MKQSPVIERLRHLLAKLESGEWSFVGDSLVIVPGKPEEYVIRYDTNNK